MVKHLVEKQTVGSCFIRAMCVLLSCPHFYLTVRPAPVVSQQTTMLLMCRISVLSFLTNPPTPKDHPATSPHTIPRLPLLHLQLGMSNKTLSKPVLPVDKTSQILSPFLRQVFFNALEVLDLFAILLPYIVRCGIFGNWHLILQCMAPAGRFGVLLDPCKVMVDGLFLKSVL